MLLTMHQVLEFQTLHSNIFYQAFSLITTQWKALFKEINQWNNFKICLLMPLENNLKKENDYIIHSCLYNYNNLF